MRRVLFEENNKDNADLDVACYSRGGCIAFSLEQVK
jgi:hypothetical protein